jgi:hypothetical protein
MLLESTCSALAKYLAPPASVVVGKAEAILLFFATAAAYKGHSFCIPPLPLSPQVAPTDIEEGMRVGVDRNKYQIQIPLPPKIDPSVTMMTVEEKPDITYSDIGGCKEQIEKMREVVELPMLHPEKFVQLGIDPPKGVLCYGPPGGAATCRTAVQADSSTAGAAWVLTSTIETCKLQQLYNSICLAVCHVVLFAAPRSHTNNPVAAKQCMVSVEPTMRTCCLKILTAAATCVPVWSACRHWQDAAGTCSCQPH